MKVSGLFFLPSSVHMPCFLLFFPFHHAFLLSHKPRFHHFFSVFTFLLSIVPLSSILLSSFCLLTFSVCSLIHFCLTHLSLPSRSSRLPPPSPLLSSLFLISLPSFNLLNLSPALIPFHIIHQSAFPLPISLSIILPPSPPPPYSPSSSVFSSCSSSSTFFLRYIASSFNQ